MTRKMNGILIWCFLMSLPLFVLGSLGFVLFSLKGSWVGLILGLSLDFFLLFMSESCFVWMTNAEKRAGGDLSMCSHQGGEQGFDQGSALYVISDVRPRVFLIRSLFSRSGSMVLTQGLMTLLKGKELEELCQESSRRLKQSGVVFMALRSWMRWVDFFILQLKSQAEEGLFRGQGHGQRSGQWKGTGFLKLIYLIGLWILFPFHALLSQVFEEDDLEFLVQQQEKFASVRAKVIRTKVIWKHA